MMNEIMVKVQSDLNLPKTVKWGSQKRLTFISLMNDFMKPVDHIGI